jgi:hypothetical protein
MYADETARCTDLPGLAACESRLHELELAQSTPSDTSCAYPAELRDRICTLASAICALAERNPDAGIGPKCTAARASCDQARADVLRKCGP